MGQRKSYRDHRREVQEWLKSASAGLTTSELIDLVKFLVTEFVAIQGALTGEVLTPHMADASASGRVKTGIRNLAAGLHGGLTIESNRPTPGTR